MMSRLLGRDNPCVYLLLHERVIARELTHLPVADEINPRVTDVPDQVLGIGKKKCGRSAAHSRLLDFTHRPLKDLAIRQTKCLGYAGSGVLRGEIVEVLELARDEVDGHLARNLSGCVASHPVGYYE
jgi:hypothetical protein